MSLSQLRNCNMGPFKGFLTGTSGVGFTLLNHDGSTQQTRTTTGVFEQVSGSGLYAAYIAFPSQFNGAIVWDTGEATPKYASEQYNTEENNPIVNTNNTLLQQVTGSLAVSATNLQFLVDMEGGRWKIDPILNQMVFYKADNTTIVATFNLLDIKGSPSIDQVTERQRV